MTDVSTVETGNQRLVRAAAASGLAAAAGLVAGTSMPNGPVVTAMSLAVLAGGFVLGLAGGFVARSRWAMLLVPAGYWLSFELAAIGARGVSSASIHLDTPVGLIAFLAGRGFHAVLAGVSMVLGAAYGVALARRLRSPAEPDTAPPAGRRGILIVRRSVVGLTTALVIVLGILIARPTGTAPIADPAGQPLPGGVAELTMVPLGGHDQAVMIRGRSADRPVLLYLAGGPGGTDLGAMRIFSESLENDFVVATWDQRGAGKSYRTLAPTSTLTLDGMVADTIEITNYLRHRFDERKIYLVGNSWGTTLGVLAVQRHPDLYHAFVGTGQMVSQRETDRMFYEDTVAWAEETGNEAIARRFREFGPPPYADPWQYAAMLTYEREWNPYPRDPEYDAKGEMPFNVFVNEYSLTEQIHAFNAFLDTAAVLYPQLQGIDFRRDVRRLDVPVYLVQGRYEARGRAVLAAEWFALLQAPTKQLTVFDASGHRPLFEEPDRFHRVLADVVGQTYNTV
jgi:pimeloyl-ACP methyl ester carboxylesterase